MFWPLWFTMVSWYLLVLQCYIFVSRRRLGGVSHGASFGVFTSQESDFCVEHSTYCDILRKKTVMCGHIIQTFVLECSILMCSISFAYPELKYIEISLQASYAGLIRNGTKRKSLNRWLQLTGSHSQRQTSPQFSQCPRRF